MSAITYEVIPMETGFYSIKMTFEIPASPPVIQSVYFDEMVKHTLKDGNYFYCQQVEDVDRSAPLIYYCESNMIFEQIESYLDEELDLEDKKRYISLQEYLRPIFG